MISLKNLKLVLLTTCLLAFANPAQAACPTKDNVLHRTVAEQQSTNVIGAFESALAAAVTASSVDRPAAVTALLDYLTTPFSITIQTLTQTLTANDYDTLYTLVSELSFNVEFVSNSVGNLTTTNYFKNACRCRTVFFEGVSYIVNIVVDDNAAFYVAFNSYSLVESPCDVFKIQTYNSTYQIQTDFAL